MTTATASAGWLRPGSLCAGYGCLDLAAPAVLDARRSGSWGRRPRRWPAGCQDNGSGGRRPRAPAPAIASVPSSAPWLARSCPARGDAQWHAYRGRVRVIQLDTVAGPQVSAVFLELGDHAHRERDGRPDLLGPPAQILPVPVPSQDQATAQDYPHLRGTPSLARRPIDKRFFYVKTNFRHERRRLPRPDRAG